MMTLVRINSLCNKAILKTEFTLKLAKRARLTAVRERAYVGDFIWTSTKSS